LKYWSILIVDLTVESCKDFFLCCVQNFKSKCENEKCVLKTNALKPKLNKITWQRCICSVVLHRLAKKFLSEKDCLALALSGVSKRFAELFGTNRYKAAIQNASLLQVMTLLFYFILQEVSYQPVPTTQTE